MDSLSLKLVNRSQGAAAITGIVLSADIVDQSDPVDTVVGSFFAIGGSGGETFVLSSNPGSYFRIDDDRDLVVDADLSGAPETVTLGVTVGSFTDSVDVTVTNTVPPDPPDEEPPVYDAGWTTPPATGKTGKGRKLVAQKGADRAALVYPLQDLEAESRMCMRLTLDASGMSAGADGLLLGFGFVDAAGQFHIVGQAWDAGAGEVRIMRAYGDQLGSSTNIAVTVVDDAAATNGSEDGPNHQQIEVAVDGLGIDFKTRDIAATVADSYDTELSDVAIAPFSDITEPTKFGVGVYAPVGNQGTLSLEIGLYPITFIGGSVASNNNTTSAVSVSVPAGATDGDLAYVMCSNYAGGSGSMVVAGGGAGAWASINGPRTPDIAVHQTFRKFLDGSTTITAQAESPAGTTDRGVIVAVFRNATQRNQITAVSSGMSDASVTSQDIKYTHELLVLGSTGGSGAGTLTGGDTEIAATGNDHHPKAGRYGLAAGGTTTCTMSIISNGAYVGSWRLHQLAPVE